MLHSTEKPRGTRTKWRRNIVHSLEFGSFANCIAVFHLLECTEGQTQIDIFTGDMHHYPEVGSCTTTLWGLLNPIDNGSLKVSEQSVIYLSLWMFNLYQSAM